MDNCLFDRCNSTKTQCQIHVVLVCVLHELLVVRQTYHDKYLVHVYLISAISRPC